MKVKIQDILDSEVVAKFVFYRLGFNINYDKRFPHPIHVYNFHLMPKVVKYIMTGDVCFRKVYTLFCISYLEHSKDRHHISVYDWACSLELKYEEFKEIYKNSRKYLEMSDAP